MNTTVSATASRFGVPILLGNVVSIEDGRVGIVDEIVGSQVVVEVDAGHVSRTAPWGGLEYVTIDAALVAHAA